MTEIEKIAKAYEIIKDAMGLLRSIEHNIEATKAADNLDITAKGLFKFLRAEDRKTETERASQPEPAKGMDAEKDTPQENGTEPAGEGGDINHAEIDDEDKEAAGAQSVERLDEVKEGGGSRADELKLNPFAKPAN